VGAFPGNEVEFAAASETQHALCNQRGIWRFHGQERAEADPHAVLKDDHRGQGDRHIKATFTAGQVPKRLNIATQAQITGPWEDILGRISV
jgi:hypothetical protein